MNDWWLIHTHKKERTMPELTQEEALNALKDASNLALHNGSIRYGQAMMLSLPDNVFHALEGTENDLWEKTDKVAVNEYIFSLIEEN